ncbi:MAG: MFS transporter, partial [Actinomycetes bacterium]
AWAIGALVGGWITDHTSSGWGLLAMGIAAIPLALLTMTSAERGETAVDAHDEVEKVREAQPKSGLRASLAALRANPTLLKVTVFAAAIAFFASPLVSLIVPIADELYHRTFITSASIMMAGLSFGEMLTPVIVGGLKKRFDDLRAAAVAALGCGLLLVVFTLDALFFQGNVELAFWVVLSLAFGGARYASRALALGAASTSRPGESEVSNMSIYFLAVMITAPIGVAWWSLMIEYVNVVTALLVGAAGTIAVSLWLLRQTQVSRLPRVIH